VTHTEMSEKPVQVLYGSLENLGERPRISFFDSDVVNFLSEFSASLLNDAESRNHGDVIAFAFWIRKSKLANLASEYQKDRNRVGYGMTFHIAPANVPLNFAYSLVSSLLAGNRNVVRVPTKIYPQVEFFIDRLRVILKTSAYNDIAHAICIVRYEKNDMVTKRLLSFSDLKIVWGGDSTVKHIRSIDTPANCKEIVFPDRKSISIVDEQSLSSLNHEELINFCEKFYTDCYLFDQNACSSPKIIFWLLGSPETFNVRQKFWDALHEIAEARYDIAPRNRILKFTNLALLTANSRCSLVIGTPSSSLTVLSFEPSKNPLSSRLVNRFGTFFQSDLERLDDLAPLLDSRIQTITYFGVTPKAIANFVIDYRLGGVDRIVPVGKALDFDLIWDGYDLPRSLSRVVTFN
jgi:hypothetical protein